MSDVIDAKIMWQMKDSGKVLYLSKRFGAIPGIFGLMI